MKQLTQAIFNGLPPEYQWAVVCKDGKAVAHVKEPFNHMGDLRWFGGRGNSTFLIGGGYDTTNFQQSKIQRETVIPVSQTPDWANRPVMPAATTTSDAYDEIRAAFGSMIRQMADGMVSYDIDDLSVEQLRHHYRCLMLSGRESNLMHIKDKAAMATRLLDAESTAKTLLDALKSLVKMHGHRDPISDKLLPPDLQPEPEIGEAMRLVFLAGGAV